MPGRVPGRVVVIGNAGLDLRLAVPRLPQPGETLIGSDGTRAPGGKGLNQAVVAQRCGVEVRFCAPLGSNRLEADEVERHLQAKASPDSSCRACRMPPTSPC